MSSMSYVRWENTYADLDDCADSLDTEEEVSELEAQYRIKVLALCQRMVATGKAALSEDEWAEVEANT